VTNRRGLIGVALVGTVCWIAYWVWHYTTTCNLIPMGGNKAITCRWDSTEAGGMTVVSRTAPALTVLWDMAARTIGIPACVIVVGIAAWWVIGKFRSRAS
jgi:hypothetical protein